MTIDIERLSQIPITKEFAEMLFNEETLIIDVEVTNHFDTYAIFKNIVSRDELCFFDDGSIGLREDSNLLYNAFQIVRYIDNYLNETP